MFRCGQITHFALQALVVSIRTVLGNRLNARLNALPMKEQDILDSFVLSCPVLLITFCSLSDLPGIACHIAGDVQNARPFSIKNLIVGFQLLVFNPRLSESRRYFATKISTCSRRGAQLGLFVWLSLPWICGV